MPKPPLKLTLGWLIPVIIIYLIFYNWLDIPLMYFISHDYQGTFLFTLSKGLKILFAPPLWFLIGVACFAYTWWSKTQKNLPYTQYILPVGINLIFAFILAFMVKFCFARYRPVDLLNTNLYGFRYFSLLAGSGSTPSGHTVMSFTLFLTFARFFKSRWITVLCMLPPILVAISRLILADHYISDVILGAYVGIISVFWGEWIRARFCSSWINSKNAPRP